MFPLMRGRDHPRSLEVDPGQILFVTYRRCRVPNSPAMSSSSLTEPFWIGLAQADLSIPRGKLRVEACGCNNISGTRENVKENSLGKRQNDSEGKGYVA